MAEPISVDEAKAHIGLLDDTSRDDLIEGYITAARMWVENHTGHVLVQREFTDTRDRFGRFIELHRRPVVLVDAITYTAADGTSQPYADGVYSIDRSPARIFPALNGWWPSLGRNGSVTVTYTAGYDPGQEPRPLLQAILLLVGHWWTNRETVVIGAAVNEVPFAVESLCGQYRTPVL
jgi:uncharacterized phiE125 gp8 family phage protein